jgi:hypothetical protein
MYVGEREVWVGLDSALEMPAFRRVIDGRPCVLIGAFTPMRWYVDETGAIAQLDAAGVVRGRFSSLRDALDQVVAFVAAP